MANFREVAEGMQYQGEDEKIVYAITTTKWGSDPSSPSAVLKDPDGTDVTSTNLTGSASASGDVITTPQVLNLIAGNLYRLEILFISGGQTLECYLEIMAEE